MINKHIIALFFGITSLLIPVFSAADTGLAIGYPFVGLKITPDFFRYISVEGKYAFGEGLSVYGFRGYANLVEKSRVTLFSGYEMGFINYRSSEINASGREYGVFAGAEIKITDIFRVSLDISPTIIELNAQNVGVGGMEWVVNAAVYLYLF